MIQAPLPLHILLIEDDSSDALLFQKYLKRASDGDLYTITTATNLTEGLNYLQRQTFDAIVSDLSLPDSSDLQTVEVIRSQFPFVALLVLSGSRASELGIAALQRGAQDYIVKGSYNGEKISTSIRYAVERQKRLAGVKAERSALDLSVSLDTITGLPNRRLLEERLELACKLAKRENRKLAVVSLELDDIEATREVFGQRVVHVLARFAADIFREHSRENDTVARVGDGRFVFILYGLDEDPDARVFARKILSALKVALVVNDSKFHLNARIGISLLGVDGETVEDLLVSSEKALSNSRCGYESRIRFHSGKLNTQDIVLCQQERALREAFHKEDLHIRYEPQLYIDEGRIRGVQAVCGMNGSETIEPMDRLLAIAESAGLSSPLYDWMFHNVCRQMGEWFRQVPAPFLCSIHLPQARLARLEMVNRIVETLRHYELPADRFAVEISGRTILDGSERQDLFFSALHSAGIRIVVPIYGTDMSMVNRMRHLPIHALKWERGSKEVMENSKGVVKAFVDLIHSMGWELIADGVDDEDRLVELQDAGCKIIQGAMARRLLDFSPLVAEGPDILPGTSYSASCLSSY